jgi:pimeloyl-ACP methyl ester carboxylesterase
LNPASSIFESISEPPRESSFACGQLGLNTAVGPRNGPPQVLLHGVTRCWQDWQPVLPELMTRWQVFALDHRGHGGSGRTPGAYRVADFAGDALAFVQAYVGERAVLWGHSLGAMTAAVVAARAPERFGALVLEDPPGTLLAGGFGQSRYQLQFTGIRRLLDEHLDAPALAERLAALPVQHPRDGRTVEFREIRDEAALRFSAECLVKIDPTVLDPLIAGKWLDGLDWFGELPRIACPTLLLRADPDCGGMLSDAEAARITQLIPQCRRVERPGLGHNLHATDARATFKLVGDFLDSFPSPSVPTPKP